MSVRTSIVFAIGVLFRLQFIFALKSYPIKA